MLLLMVAGYDCAISRYYLPPTDGWWNIYAWSMARGYRLYDDLYIAFPPLHALLIAAQRTLLGDYLLAYRFAGVPFHALGVGLTFAWLFRLFGSFPAFWGALVSALWIVSRNSAYASGDYHTMASLFVSLSLYLSTYLCGGKLVDTSAPVGASRDFVALLGIGFSCGCLLLLKQNIGVFFTLGMIVFVAASNAWFAETSDQRLRRALVSLAILAVGIALPLLAVTAFIGPSWVKSYIGNKSKGSTGDLLFRFITNPETRAFILTGLLIPIVVCWPLFVNYWPPAIVEITGRLTRRLGRHRRYAVVLAKVIIVLFIIRYFNIRLFALLMPLSISGVVYYALLAWHGRPVFHWHRFGFVPLSMFVYANTMTAGLNPPAIEHVAAFSFAAAAMYFVPSLDRRRWRVSYALAVGFFVLALGSKLTGPLYSWWGLSQGNFFQATHVLPFNQLSGFKVDEDTKTFFDIVYEYRSGLSAEDKILAYPSIPIVNFLLEKPPFANTPITWFDVTDGSMAEPMIEKLNADPPKYIFWLLPPYGVYEGHAMLRGRTSLPFLIDQWVFGTLGSGQYVLDRRMNWRQTPEEPFDIVKQVVSRIFVTREAVTCGEYIWTKPSVQDTEDRPPEVCVAGESLSRGESADFIFESNYKFQKATEQFSLGVVIDKAYIQHQFLVLRRVN